MSQSTNYKQATITVYDGNITNIPATAIATLINSGGLWFGGLDSAIQSVAGNYYHAQAAAASPLSDGEVVLARGPQDRTGLAFEHVIFVVDDLKQQLNDLVFLAIQEAYQQDQEAYQQDYASVSLPLMRTGVMKNAVEPVAEVPKLMVNGIIRAVNLYERTIQINIVAYRDNATANRVLAELLRLG